MILDNDGFETWGQIYYGRPNFSVICIKNYWINTNKRDGQLGKRELPITVGKTYIVETDHRFHHKLNEKAATEYIIEADDKQLHGVPPDFFITMREQRERKLKRILK